MSPDNKNDYKIVPPKASLDWIKAGALFIIDRPFFWLFYSTFFAACFSLSSNLVYLHTIAVIFMLSTFHVSLKMYGAQTHKINLDFLLRNAMFVFNFLFICFFIRYIVYLSSSAKDMALNLAGSSTQGTSQLSIIALSGLNMSDYLNPLEMISSGLWNKMFDLFIFNFAIMPFYYIQISVLCLFCVLFFYPLFVWKENSMMFSLSLGTKISLANLKPVLITFAFCLMVSLAVDFFPLSAFPYLYAYPSAIVFHMWTDIFDIKPQMTKSSVLTDIDLAVQSNIQTINKQQ